MGWKTLKERFKIESLVSVSHGEIHVGNYSMQRMFAIDIQTGELRVVRAFHWFLDARYPALKAANPAVVLEAINAVDEFSASIPVFTYHEGEIIEKQCEQLGWPNVTHDGCLMYDNTFSTDRNQVVVWAIRDMKARCEFAIKDEVESEKKLTEARVELTESTALLAKLASEYPAIAHDEGVA